MNQPRRFFCPHCDHELGLPGSEFVRMQGRLYGPNFSVTATFDVPSGLGVYGGRWNDYLKLEEGGLVEFSCPECSTSFTTGYNDRLAEIKMTEGDQLYVVVFNRAFGEHSSFLIDYQRKEVVASFGEHAHDFIDEFGKNINFFGH
ncbi:MAG: hypothetical protein JW797_19670 [Bradymonadales bacterium]|nr:hypothetical protein [Bradymonadales bacterium]